MTEPTEKKKGIFETYPYEKIESRETFRNRPLIRMGKDDAPEDQTVWMELDMEQYPAAPVFSGNDEKGQACIDFLLHRIWDYANALDQAENQIADILHHMPFLPEEFGFKKRDGLDGVEYWKISGDKGSMCIMQRVENTDYEWYLNKNIFALPNYKTAYTVLTSLGLFKEGEQKAMFVTITDEEVDAELQKQEDLRVATEKVKAAIPTADERAMQESELEANKKYPMTEKDCYEAECMTRQTTTPEMAEEEIRKSFKQAAIDGLNGVPSENPLKLLFKDKDLPA